jgi:hypothetical protein
VVTPHLYNSERCPHPIYWLAAPGTKLYNFYFIEVVTQLPFLNMLQYKTILYTWKMSMGMTSKVYPSALLKEVRLCCGFTSGARSKIPAKMIVYRTPTRERHIRIHRGTNTTSQLQEINPSSLRAKKMNWRMFTEQNNSNFGEEEKKKRLVHHASFNIL